MAVIDVHTHMLTEEYLGFLAEHGGPKYELKPTKAGQNSIYMQDAPFMTLKPEMWNYDARIRDMDAAGIDLAIVSLTCPNAFLGDESISVRAARMVNDSMNEQQCARPDRIAWFASIPDEGLCSGDELRALRSLCGGGEEAMFFFLPSQGAANARTAPLRA